MEYTTTIKWHTDFPARPGDDLTKLPIQRAMLLIKSLAVVGPHNIELLSDCQQNDDGSWSIHIGNGKYRPLNELYPSEYYKLMAWGEFPISNEAVDTLCNASNKDNYGITECDFSPRCFINVGQLPDFIINDVKNNRG